MTSENKNKQAEPDVETTTGEILDASTNQTPSTSTTTADFPEFGWSSYAERINGRFAMLGFASILLIEVFSRNTFFHWIGIFK